MSILRRLNPLVVVLALLALCGAALAGGEGREGLRYQRDGQAARIAAKAAGLDVVRATRVKGVEGLALVETRDGKVIPFRQNVTGFTQREALRGVGADRELGDGTGKGLRTVTRSGQLRVHSEKAGIVANELERYSFGFTGTPAPRRDPASKPTPTHASIEKAAYFHGIDHPGQSNDANWAAGEAAERARAANGRSKR